MSCCAGACARLSRKDRRRETGDGGRAVAGDTEGTGEDAGRCQPPAVPVVPAVAAVPGRRVRRLWQLLTKLMKALKGRDIPAQGNALGNEAKTDEP